MPRRAMPGGGPPAGPEPERSGVSGPLLTGSLPDETYAVAPHLAEPNRGGLGDRILRVEQRSFGFLPSRMTLDLAQGSLADHQLDRAARLLAQRFDLSPTMVLKPRVTEAGTIQSYNDPVTDGAITLETARRFMQINEVDFIRKMLGNVVRAETHVMQRGHGKKLIELDPARVRKVIAAMAPLDGQKLTFAVAFAAATQIAGDEHLDLNLFASNLEMSSRFDSLPPEQQIAAAHHAAASGRAINSVADLAESLVRPETIPLLQAAEAERSKISTLSPELQLGQAITSGLSSGDWMKALQDAQDDYDIAAKELANNVKLPFPITMAGSAIGWTLNRLGRGLDAVYRLAEVPFDPLGPFGQQTPEVAGVQEGSRYMATEGVIDAWDILMGRTTATEELQKDAGMPWGMTAIGELALGFFIDPVQIGMNSWAAYKGAHLINGVRTGLSIQGIAQTARTQIVGQSLRRGGSIGTKFLAGDWRHRMAAMYALGDDFAGGTTVAADAKAAAFLAKADAFLHGQVRRIGDLRGVTVAEYLLRESDRTKDPALFFGRAVDNFRRWFGTGSGIDPFTAEQMWRWSTNAKKLGVSEADRLSGIQSVLAHALGLPTETGSLAHQVETLSQIRRVEAADDLQRAIIARPTARSVAAGQELQALGPMPEEALAAMAVLDDTALEFTADVARQMTEVPHVTLPGSPMWIDNYLRTSRLADTEFGRILRSAMQTNPIRAGSRIALNIESPESVRDFERTLLRSKRWSPAEIAAKKLEYTKAIARTNPNREAEWQGVVAGAAAETMRRSNARWGVGPDLEKMTKEMLGKRFGSPDGNVFAAFRLDDAERLRANELMETITSSHSQGQIKAARAELQKLSESKSIGQIGEAFLPSQFNNTVEFLDPVLYEAGIAEMMGTVRKWNRALRSHLGPVTPTNKRAPLRLRLMTDRVAETLIQDLFLTVWKPLAVIRPAYILRVVGIEEFARFLATGGLMRRLESGPHSAALLGRMGLVADRRIALDFALAEEVGQRANSVEDGVLFLTGRHVPGLKDFKGWNSQDGPVGIILADIIKNGGTLDDAQRAQAMRMLRTYPTQLKSVGIDVRTLKLHGDPGAAAQIARDNQLAIDEGMYRLTIPGMLPDEEMVNNVGSARHMMATEGQMRAELARIDPSHWTGKVRTDKGFVEAWHHTMAFQYGSDPIGNRILQGFGKGWDEEKVHDDVVRWLMNPKGDGPRHATRLMHGVEDFTEADVAYQVRIGTQYLRDLTAGRPELADAAAHHLLTVDMLKMIDPQDWPLYTHGAAMAELNTSKVGPIKRIRDYFGRMILREPTNRLIRQPYFKHWYDHVLEGLIAQAGETGQKITPEMLEGFQETARQFGISQVKRVMFDFSRTGRLEEMSRFGLVFVQPYFEEPLAWARIIRQNPAVAWHAARIGKAGLNSGFIQKDPETGELVIPASLWAGMAPLLALATRTNVSKGKFQGGGWELSIPLQAFNLFASGTLGVNLGSFGGEFPLPLPSLAPPAQWAMQHMITYAQDHDIAPGVTGRLAAWLYQYGAIGPNNVMGLAPAWLRHGLEAAFPDQFKQNQDFLATHFLQVQEAMGQAPDAGKARGQAEAFAALRMVISWIFPGAPRIEFPTVELEREHSALIESLGYIDGNAKWMELHKDLRLLTISRTVWNKNDPNDPLRSDVPIPTTKLVDNLLHTKGARDFAAKYPQWVFAIIPSELAAGEFDPGSFFAQIARGDRLVRSPEEFILEGKVQDGWDAFFMEDTSWTSWQEANPQYGENDLPYEQEKALHDKVIQNLVESNPDWAQRKAIVDTSGVPATVWRQARALAQDPMFLKTDVGQGLRDYIALRDTIDHDLGDNEIHTIKSAVAVRLGISQRYTDGVAAIIEAHPEFATAYRLFFENDLEQGITTAGDRWIESVSQETFDTRITPWWNTYEELKDGPGEAVTPEDRNAAYGALRSYINQTYDDFSASENPMIGKWKQWGLTDKQNYQLSVMARSYQFYSRFDKETVLHGRSNKATEKLWSDYEVFRTAISQAEDADPNGFNSGAAYDALDVWVNTAAAKNKLFGQQVKAANTWGYAFEQVRGELFQTTDDPTGGRAKRQWDAFLDGLRQYQAVATAAGLTGFNDRDPQAAALYRLVQGAILKYVDQLKASSVEFAAQWDWLEHEDSQKAAIRFFMPEIYYPLGGGALNGA